MRQRPSFSAKIASLHDTSLYRNEVSVEVKSIFTFSVLYIDVLRNKQRQNPFHAHHGRKPPVLNDGVALV